MDPTISPILLHPVWHEVPSISTNHSQSCCFMHHTSQWDLASVAVVINIMRANNEDTALHNDLNTN